MYSKQEPLRICLARKKGYIPAKYASTRSVGKHKSIRNMAIKKARLFSYIVSYDQLGNENKKTPAHYLYKTPFLQELTVHSVTSATHILNIDVKLRQMYSSDKHESGNSFRRPVCYFIDQAMV